MNPQKITEQAKKIMDSFIAALDKSGKADVHFEVKRDQNIRDEKVSLNVNKDFSERMLKNAPLTKDNYILAERKKW